MSQTFVGDTRVPLTVVNVGPMVVTHIKREEKDGYWAVQVGFGEKRAKLTSKQLQGHLKKASKNKKFPRFVREIRVEKEPKVKVGDQIQVSEVFKVGDVVQVTGVSKGKGFAGVIKRWGFAGGPRTHGQSDRQRAPGSIGQGTDPGRVWKGKKMPGRMGTDTVTVKNLVVVGIDENELTVSGPVPGAPKGLLIISKIRSGKLSDLDEKTVEVEMQKEVEEEEEKKEGEEK